MDVPAFGEFNEREARRGLGGRDPNAHFRRLLEVLPAGAYTCDPEGLITYFNAHAARLWGRAPKLADSEDRYCGSFKLFSTDGSPIRHDECWMALALQTGLEYNGREIVVERPNGERVTALAHANPIFDERGRLLGAVNVLVDITKQKQAEEVLREADRSKNEFLATLSHELRNPLSPIRHAVEILHRQKPATPQAQWAVEVIDRQVNQLTRLVDDLLDVARITRNRLELRKEKVRLSDLIHAAVEISHPLIAAGGHDFVVRDSSEPLYVEGDPSRLAQVVSNLLNNSAKYTPCGGRIGLTAERQGRDAIISVEDTGVGIPAEMLPQIFEMFEQVHRERDVSEGLGIGLALAKHVVDRHGGTIEAHSDGPGTGSRFTIRLPALEGGPSSTPELAPATRSYASSLRVLVVDDNADVLESLSLLLEMVGHEVQTVPDGARVENVAIEFRPDVVLLDIGLPDVNGYDVARRLRRRPETSGTILVAHSGWGQEEDRRRSIEAGFDHHLVKPVDPDDLMDLLSSLRDEVVAD